MRVLIVLAAVALLSACTSGTVRNARTVVPPTQQLDYERMAAVENDLRTRYAQVIWVSPPTKRVASDD
jgi:hypothetical protein